VKKSNLIIYQAPDGSTKIDAFIENETVWLTQNQMAELFQTTKQNISLHLKNIYEEGELIEEATVKDFFTVQKEGARNVKRNLSHYNLDVVISVGYRVKSHVATKFRIWATERIKEYIIKGFVLDNERLKEARNHYFDELLAEIRDIRSSEKLFYRKVCDIFATSADYDPSLDQSKQFFASVQNKFHWAIHRNTAAELIQQRADATKPLMGITNTPGKKLKREDVNVAKNYLNKEELEQLNRIVNQYLEFAELQALNRKVMYMKDWEDKLNGFLQLNDMEILRGKGKVSQEDAKKHALKEYEKFKLQLEDEQSQQWLEEFKKLNPPKKKK